MKQPGPTIFISLLLLVFFSCESGPGVNPADGFFLTYESQGSEYPAVTRLSIYSTGECRLFQSKPDYGDSIGSIEDRQWKLGSGDFTRLVTTLVDKIGFFTLPPEVNGAVLEVMDSSTVWIEVSWKGKTWKIGGYNAYDFDPYVPVLQLLDETIALIEKNAARK
jgi:hypothetical protein